MFDYHWPGNIRELRNTIERIVLLEQGPELRAEHLPFAGGHDEAASIGKRIDQVLSVLRQSQAMHVFYLSNPKGEAGGGDTAALAPGGGDAMTRIARGGATP